MKIIIRTVNPATLYITNHRFVSLLKTIQKGSITINKLNKSLNLIRRYSSSIPITFDPFDDQDSQPKQEILNYKMKSYELPSPNFNRNTKRFIAVMSLIKLLTKILQNYDKSCKAALQPISKLIFNVEMLYKSDPRSFVSLSKLYCN